MNAATVYAALATAGLLSACGTAPLPPEKSAHLGPRGFLASSPPADISFTPLRCVSNGPGVDCSRTP